MNEVENAKKIFKISPYYKLGIEDIKVMFQDIPGCDDVFDKNTDTKSIVHILYNMSCDSPYDFESELISEIKKRTDVSNVISSVQCKHCKEFKVITFTRQTRAADEPETVFTICWNCNHRTRS